MSDRIRLIHLTVLGSGRPPASIEFGSRLTVIHGASDTGKSHVFDLIHFAFGLRKHIDVPEQGDGYQYVHLGIGLQNGDVITLVRDLTGGKIGFISSDIRDLITDKPAEYLDARHVSKNPNSVSRRLLSLIGLDEIQVRRNQYNETRMLRWRDVIHLSAVGEEALISKSSPIEFGQYSDRTVESSIFRLFIENQDDSGLQSFAKRSEVEKISSSKLEILDQIILKLEEELVGVPAIEQLDAQLVRLNDSLHTVSVSLESARGARDSLAQELQSNSRAIVDQRERRDEIASLRARFALLREHYDSDLQRLQMLDQVADVLAIDVDEECPFCGASSEHQDWADSALDETDVNSFTVAVSAEESKIHLLRADLNQAIEAIDVERQEISSSLNVLSDQNSRISQEARRLDDMIRTPGAQLSTMLETRSRVERQIDSYNRLSELLQLRADSAETEKPKTTTDEGISSDDLREFNQIADEILQHWSFPRENSVHYSAEDRDLVVGQRSRRTHGKGVRSILHALFNVALAEYSIRQKYPHPGFVILDSPIVSYRQPGDPVLQGEEETIASSVVDAFYSYLQKEFQGQSLILENKPPISPLPDGTVEYFFGGESSDGGRAGFYPPNKVE